jgi:predicted nucleic acid-binding protein
VIDTSVWSLLLRRKVATNSPQVQWLINAIQSGQAIFLLGIIVQELLQGIREKTQFTKLAQKLSSFPLIDLLLWTTFMLPR